VSQHIELIKRVREAQSIEEASRLTEELSRALGIPVYWDEYSCAEGYDAALVINTDRSSDIAAWLDICYNNRLGKSVAIHG